jgi:hypothetical protein
MPQNKMKCGVCNKCEGIGSGANLYMLDVDASSFARDRRFKEWSIATVAEKSKKSASCVQKNTATKTMHWNYPTRLIVELVWIPLPLSLGIIIQNTVHRKSHKSWQTPIMRFCCRTMTSQM